jgi:ligand-binding sensor domain-containing protein/two-component sensor histidine kinase
MKKNYLVLLIIFLTSLQAIAQAPSLFFEKLTTQNDLSNNKVNCIVQDKRGFMWIGTNDGLNRFDGNNFVVFRNKPGDSTSISGNIITHIIEDASDVLWIATADGGMSRYNYKLQPSQQFKQYKNKPGDAASIPSNGINQLLDDGKGFIWMATSGSMVIRFDKKKESFQQVYRKGPKTALSLCFDDKGLLWVGRQGGGILKINTDNLSGEYDKRYDDLYAKLPHVVVTELYKDRDNNIWFGSWDKLLYQYNTAIKQEKSFQVNGATTFNNDQVEAFAEDGLGRLWIGGKNNGLQILDKATGFFYHYTHNPLLEGTIANNAINCIYRDRLSKIWVGTDKGISVHNPRQQQFVQTFLESTTSIPVTSVYDFYRDENNDLWIGTNAGIFLQRNNYTGIEYRSVNYEGTPLAVTHFYKDKNGVFYVGTNYSLFVYNRNTNAVQLLPNTEKDQVMNKIIASRVVSVAEDTIDGNPVLMVSPYGHFMAYYDLVSKQWVSRLDTVRKILTAFKINDYLIHKFYKSSAGSIWLANAQQGLGEWINNPKPEVRYYKNNPAMPDGLSNNHVYDITEDTQRNLWISTYGGGLNYFNLQSKKINHVPASNNLLEGIAIDAKGNVWMISNGQLQRYDVTGKFTSSLTLPDLEKSGGVSGYLYKDPVGKMYMGGKNYFIAFDPEKVSYTNIDPPVYLTDFKIFNTSYGHLLNEKTIRLSYSKNYFTIDFAAPDYSFNQPIKYAYMLEGFNNDWVETGTHNTATFSNLEGGTYTFKVRVSNNPGEWSKEVATIKIVIIPPLWKRWWFFVLCGLAVSGIIYAVYRYRINELLKRQGIRNKIAQDLHDNMGSTLSSISVYSQVAHIQNENGKKEELNQILSKISTTSTEMITEMNDIVWAINPRNDSMEKIVQRMESFAKPLLAARNIRFDFQYDKQMLQTNLEMEKRKNFYLIFKEAVNNAIKYSGASELKVHIKYNHGRLELIVQDNGVGFNVEKEMKVQSLSGNGLKNIQMRSKEMGAELQIQSSPGGGTTVYLNSPIP